MINGGHILWYSKDADKDRAFLRDVLGLRAIDIGHGWIIFAMPPCESAVHPADEADDQGEREHRMMTAHMYFMCENLDAEIASLAKKGVTCSAPQTQPWGIVTTIPLPSGGEIGLYQPKHPTAI
jgi:predicted enzyme related to lactoylglutathione lyase